MAVVSALFSRTRLDGSDFGQVWAAARAWTQGLDPYAAVGPGLAFEWPFPLFYPMSAVLVAVPFAWCPLWLADALFVGCGFGLFAYAAVTKERRDDPRVLMCASMAGVMALRLAQWSPLLCAAALVPALAPLLACKPTLGLALFAAWPSWRGVIGIAGFLAVSLVASPLWPWQWWETIQQQGHIVAPITRPGGVLVLLALRRWRLPEARLLVAWACIPHTAGLYEAVPLFLLVKTWPESISLTILTWVVGVIVFRIGPPYASFQASMDVSGNWMLWLLFLPCTALLLWRGSAAELSPQISS
jgi:hypothetical protein